MTFAQLSICASLLFSAVPALADAPQVAAARAVPEGGNRWTFEVTIRHPDSGWDHYASGWSILAPNGELLGDRELTHPHQDEQPFTRSLEHVSVPAGLDHVLIRVRCTLDGWSAALTRLDLGQ